VLKTILLSDYLTDVTNKDRRVRMKNVTLFALCCNRNVRP